jgi:alkylation response protein AidB-like acyl-CoA dehydrogenase
MAAPQGRGPEVRVKLLQIYEGTNQIQRLVIAKEIQQGN